MADGKPVDVVVLATRDGSCKFAPQAVQRRALRPDDVLIDMKYCGVCHSDLHFAAGHVKMLMNNATPCVPGHELAGVCVAVGSAVTKFKVGDQVGVGCMVDSCQKPGCGACGSGEEQKCAKQVGTYGSKDNGSGRAAPAPGAPAHTLGGYTTRFVVNEKFGVRIPDGYPLEKAGPVMCAGVTLYDPMRKAGVGPGSRVAVVGIGGLGQMGVRIAKALGATVTAVTRGAGKAAFAKACGADAVVISTDAASMAGAAGSVDLVLNTIPSQHDYTVYSSLLAKGGSQVLLGLHNDLVAGIVADALCCGGSRVKGSGIGGIAATQEVMDLCAKHGIQAETKLVAAHEMNAVYAALDGANDSGVRYVLDIATLSLAPDTVAACAAAPAPKIAAYKGVTAGGILSALGAIICTCRWRRR